MSHAINKNALRTTYLAIEPHAFNSGALQAAGNIEQQSQGNIAILNVRGTIDESNGTSLISPLADKVKALVEASSVSAIILNIDSPGGYVTGVPEAADAIYSMRGSKPIVAVANHMAASAAYWLGAAATKFYASPSADVGSIGVFAMHADMSKFYEESGIKVTYISAGKYKVEGNPFEPLGQEAMAAAQSRVDEIYNQFTGDVARFRGDTKAKVQSGYGQGRVLSAKAAQDQGMIDGVKTLAQVVADMSKSKRTAFNRAQHDSLTWM